jgi:hypothetical protein
MKNDEKHDAISLCILKLRSKIGLVRKRARKKLVSIGAPAVSRLAELIDQPVAKVRWEAVKTLGQIADPGSVPLFIKVLDDKDEEVRWLAAEGLIAVGTHAIKPLLQELIKNPKSMFLRKGAHHYFNSMQELSDSSRFKDLLSALEAQDAELGTPGAAEKLLKIMKFK